MGIGKIRREMEAMNDTKKSWLIRFYSNPLVGFIGSTASIIGLVVFVLSVIHGRTNRDLSYYCNPIRTSIVKSGRSSVLEVVWNNEKLSTDVTGSQVAIWNNGKRPIEKSDILEEIEIFTQPKTPILEADIIKTSRNVIDLVLNKDKLNDGCISVSWKILEQFDGGTIQVIYAGDEVVKLSIRGIVKEQRNIRQLEYTSKIMSPLDQIEAYTKDNRL
jgi:hypothetical protein